MRCIVSLNGIFWAGVAGYGVHSYFKFLNNIASSMDRMASNLHKVIEPINKK